MKLHHRQQHSMEAVAAMVAVAPPPTFLLIQTYYMLTAMPTIPHPTWKSLKIVNRVNRQWNVMDFSANFSKMMSKKDWFNRFEFISAESKFQHFMMKINVKRTELFFSFLEMYVRTHEICEFLCVCIIFFISQNHFLL